jgi:hypothetical protein
MDEKKQIAFYYDGELAEDETIVDIAGTEIVPEIRFCAGAERNGRLAP